MITLYIVRVITGMANKHLLQQIVFIFWDMSVCLLWLSISQIIHHAFTNNDIKNNRRQRNISLKMNCCNRCMFTIQIITIMIYIRGIISFIFVTILIYCIFTVLLHIYTVGSRFATVRFMIHFYDLVASDRALPASVHHCRNSSVLSLLMCASSSFPVRTLFFLFLF